MRDDTVGLLFMLIFVIILLVLVGFFIADAYSDSIAKSLCEGAGYDSGSRLLWAGDTFCSNTETQIYHFAPGETITPLEK